MTEGMISEDGQEVYSSLKWVFRPTKGDLGMRMMKLTVIARDKKTADQIAQAIRERFSLPLRLCHFYPKKVLITIPPYQIEQEQMRNIQDEADAMEKKLKELE
jgi:predicted component of type VI protein secretion system